MKAGSGKIGRSVWVEFNVECSKCDAEATTKLGEIEDRGDAAKYFRSHGWAMRKGQWVCPDCLHPDKVDKTPVATKVEEAAQKAADKLSREARGHSDKDMAKVARQDAADFRTIRDFAKAGDLPAAARFYRNMDTAARDYLECDDETLGALGFERIGGKR